MRRAVVRAAVSASRVPSTKTSMLGAAFQFAVPSVARVSAPVAAVRYFSQTLRFASTEFSSASESDSNSSQSKQGPYPISCVFYK